MWYNENGRPDAIENYKDGKYDGNYEEYYANGNIKAKAIFFDGKQNGWAVNYHDDGSKQSEGNFKNGNRDGAWKYYEDGKVVGTETFKTEYQITEAHIFLRLPNDSWHLTPTPEGNPIQYIFKRDKITDSEGRDIIPAIMVWFTDAGKYQYKLDGLVKERLGTLKGLRIEQTLHPGDKDYPLPFKNGVFYKASYTLQNVDHVLYIVYLINKQNIAFQIALDMTKNINPEYDPEFWATIRSLRDL